MNQQFLELGKAFRLRHLAAAITLGLLAVLLAALLPNAAFAASGASTLITAGNANITVQAGVSSYTYETTPVLAPFNGYVYVKTDNPDPYSFRLVDKSSKYFSNDSSNDYGKGVYHLCEHNYLDAVYENAKTFRVKGGYLFLNMEYDSDGGQLVVQEATTSDPARISVGDGFISIPGDMDYGWKDSSVKSNCPALKTYTDYLIDTYANDSDDLFENLNAVETGLAGIARYPRRVYDSSKPNPERPYPFLATSPYPELSLNEHFDIYQSSSDGLLITAAYPFILDSASFPGTMAAVAKKLDPDCTVSSVASAHWLIEVSKDGKTQQQGWGTPYGSDPIYSNRAKTDYVFDGSPTDFGTHGSVEALLARLKEYGAQADEDNTKLEAQLSPGAVAEAIAPGAWAQVASEGWFGYGTTFAYIALDCNGYGYTVASDAWVDGRYVNEHECVMLNQKFADHPQADIIVRNVTFTDRSGTTRTSDIVYSYDSATDTWRAPDYYEGGWYSTMEDLPELFVLTRAEVDAMHVDAQSNHIPASGVIIDGTKPLGTNFANVLVEGISLSKNALTMMKGETVTVTAAVNPANATDNRVNWTSGNEGVATVYDGRIQAVAAGTATITATTTDGGYSETCQVTVREPPSISKATVAEIPAKYYTGKGIKPVPKVMFGGAKLTEGVDYTLSYSSNVNAGTAKITITGKGSYTGTKTVRFQIKPAANEVTLAKGSMSKKLSAKSLKKKAQTLTLPKFKAKFGKGKWEVSTRDSKKVLTLSNGAIKVKKGAPKGVYTIKVRAAVANTSNYKRAVSKVLTVKVQVK